MKQEGNKWICSGSLFCLPGMNLYIEREREASYTSHYSFTLETKLSAQQMLFGDDRQNSDNFLSAISSEHGHLPRE